MPGIAGLITNMLAELQQMLQSIRHESFYVQAVYTDEALGLYAGVVERSDAYDTPMPQRSESGDKVLLFSGDEFPEQGNIDKLVDHLIGAANYTPEISRILTLEHLHRSLVDA